MSFLNNIDRERRTDFPPGVREVSFETMREINAFIQGIRFAEALGVTASDPFTRNGAWVLRILTPQEERTSDG